MTIRPADAGIVLLALLASLWIFWPKTPAQPTKTPTPWSDRRVESNVSGMAPADLLASLELQQAQKGYLDTDSTALWAEGNDAAPMWVGTVGELKAILRSMADGANGAAWAQPQQETLP